MLTLEVLQKQSGVDVPNAFGKDKTGIPGVKPEHPNRARQKTEMAIKNSPQNITFQESCYLTHMFKSLLEIKNEIS